jgi:hypothetical protein
VVVEISSEEEEDEEEDSSECDAKDMALFMKKFKKYIKKEGLKRRQGVQIHNQENMLQLW